ncbi:MAG: protein O-mannosyl-transferase family [Chitinispirillaceae bacterium]
MEQLHAKLNKLGALFVFAVSFIVFILTAAPTVAFWDCAEYTATGHSLGIAHPPGNPLLIMMLRVASMGFSFFEDIGFRMNILIVTISALTAMFIYLIAVRVITGMIGTPDSNWKRLTVYIGGIVAGLFAVFGRTFWFSAVEQSEANPSMLAVVIPTWLALVWAQSKHPKRDILLIVLTYVSFLGIAIHMYSMIVLPPIFLFVMLKDKEKLRDWRLWLTAGLVGSVILDMPLFIWLGSATVLVTLAMTFIDTANAKKWRFCFFLALFAIVGFSSHLYLPIRSNLEPAINQNHPATWEAFRDYLQRKQYGSESMFTRMLWRRGTFKNQFGIEGHMGYGGFHITQFFRFSDLDTQRSLFADGFLTGWAKLLVYLIPTALMIFAWGFLYKRNKKSAIYLISLFLLTSIGLVLYMNFADGTRPERLDYERWVQAGKPGPMPTVHREVRVRDYFFGAAFMYLGMWLGIAASALMYVLFTNKDKFLRTAVAPMAVILFAVSPALPLTQNWAISSRKGDYMPYDYAHNLLMSVAKNGIIFTNGDNDTFPLWALQEAYGVRKDVRVVNLSLVNTPWYIKQLKNQEPKVPISYSESQIDLLRPEHNPYERDAHVKMAGLDLVIPGRQKMNALKVQDKMVLNIFKTNNWKKPLYFASTVPENAKMGLEPYVKLEGLAQRVMPHKVKEDEKVNVDRTAHLLDDVFKFRGLETGRDSFDNTSSRMVYNYANTYIQLGLTLDKQLIDAKREIGALEKIAQEDSTKAELLKTKTAQFKEMLDMAISKMNECVKLVPTDWRPRYVRHEILIANDMAKEAENYAQKAVERFPKEQRYKQMLAQALEKQGKKQDANKALDGLKSSEVDPFTVYYSMAKNYEESGMYDSALHVMKRYAQQHPEDKQAAVLIEHYRNLKEGKGSKGATAPEEEAPVLPQKDTVSANDS